LTADVRHSRRRLSAGWRSWPAFAHTRCGLIDADETALCERLTEETGQSHDIEFGACHDVEASVRSSIGRLRAHAWLRRGPVHGLIFDVATGRRHEVAVG